MKRIILLLAASAAALYFSGGPIGQRAAIASSEIPAALDLSIDGASYDRAKLEATALYLQQRGVTPERSRQVVVQLVQDGARPDEVALFARMALRLGAMTGQGIGYAAFKLVDAFNGRIEKVTRLDKELNFLTADQYRQIRDAADAGKFPTARQIGLDALAARLDR